MRKNYLCIFSFLATAIFVATLGFLQAEKKRDFQAVNSIPDLVSKDLEITRLSVEASGAHRIRIKAVVLNPVAKSATGPFQVRLEWRNAGAAAEYALLGQENVATLVNSGISLIAPQAVLFFEHSVPAGRTHTYRVKADPAKLITEINENNNIKDSDYRAASGFPDGGGDEAYSSGIDLVVSQVEIIRGTFAGRQKIQVIPTIVNMWHGRTNARIKILFDGLGLAEWIEDGIGPDERKRAGAVYIDIEHMPKMALNFYVEVDNEDVIDENNEGNNRCGPVIFDWNQTHIIHICPIRGPHGPLI